ncbi:MAG: serine/threonine protein kinase [Planctomycetes bacterium]|nr:serine/threonine protein kinase [Planctomycetota bacterium]
MKLTCANCATEVEVPGDVRVDGYVCADCRGALPRTIGKYPVLAFIGAGGMGRVYKALHPELQKTVAVKVFSGEGGPAFLERFLREARLSATLTHPGIVQVHDAGRDGDRPFLVMEYVEGRSLRDEIGAGMEPARCVPIATQVARALHFAHEHGIVHRDVKPNNILIDREGRARLLDFGLARSIRDERLSVTGDVIGTPSYMAPEQALGAPDKVDRRADVYALGATLYDMLTGRAPLKGDTVYDLIRRIPTEIPAPPSSVRPGIPPALDALCMRALAKKPEDRFPTAASFADAIERVLAAPPPRRRRSRAWIAVPAVLLAIPVLFHLTWSPAKRAASVRLPEPATVARSRPPVPKTAYDRFLDRHASCDAILALAVPGIFGLDAGEETDALEREGLPLGPTLLAKALVAVWHTDTLATQFLGGARAAFASPGDVLFAEGFRALVRFVADGEKDGVVRWIDRVPQDPPRRTLVLAATAKVLLGDESAAPARLGSVPEAGLLRAVQHQVHGRYDEAQRIASEAGRRYGSFDGEAYGEVMCIFAALADPAAHPYREHDAHELLKRLEDAATPPRLFVRIFAASVTGDWSSAAADLAEFRKSKDRGLKIRDPMLRALVGPYADKRAELMVCVAEIQLRLGHHETARRRCRDLVQKGRNIVHPHPEEVLQRAHLVLALIADAGGKPEEAIESLEEALKAGWPVGAIQEDARFAGWAERAKVKELLKRHGG